MEAIKLLDHGYLKFIEHWGSDERIIESARMSTNKGFLGWGPRTKKNYKGQLHTEECASWALEDVPGKYQGSCNCDPTPGDEKLLRYLYENKHSTPFEMAGLIIEVQAPIFVFREWHRHRTQCLHPDTLIHFDAPKSRQNRHFVYKMRIEDVWKKWQPTVRHSRPERQTNALFPRSRVQAMQLRRLNEEAREFGHTRITDVIQGAPKQMVRVTTASGRSVSLTLEHRVLTSVGWMRLVDALRQGALLTLEGTTRNKAKRWEVPDIDEGKEEWRPVVGWESLYQVSNQGRVRRLGCSPRKTNVGANGYNVVSLSRNGQTTLHTTHSLVLEAFVGSRPQGCEARHKNHNRADARVENLEWGTAQDNSRDRVESDRNQRLVPVFEEIVEAVDIGLAPTFDLAVEGPWHNFVADGFVVHNSYNELSARYTPLPDLNYIPTIERLMLNSKSNKQAGVVAGAAELDAGNASIFQHELRAQYEAAQKLYEWALQSGVPKELARVHLPVGRYSRMRASANLRNWLQFLTLRMAPNAQWEIRQYANAVGTYIQELYPRTWELFVEGDRQ